MVQHYKAVFQVQQLTLATAPFGLDCSAWPPGLTVVAGCYSKCVHKPRVPLLLLLLLFLLCRAEKEALSNELNDLREMMAAEANSRAALQDALAAAERQLGEARNELDMTKAVSGNNSNMPYACTHGSQSPRGACTCSSPKTSFVLHWVASPACQAGLWAVPVPGLSTSQRSPLWCGAALVCRMHRP